MAVDAVPWSDSIKTAVAAADARSTDVNGTTH